MPHNLPPPMAVPRPPGPPGIASLENVLKRMERLEKCQKEIEEILRKHEERQRYEPILPGLE